MRPILCACTFLILMMSTSCIRHVVIGRGKLSSKTLVYQNFNKLDLSASLHANVTVREGSEYAVSLSGYENILKEIKTELKDGTLRVYTEDELDLGLKNNTELVITMPALSTISLSGAPDIDVHGIIKNSDLTIYLSGAGKIVIDSFSVGEFNANLSGAAKMQVKGGSATSSSLDISGAGVVDAYGLHSDSASVDISGAGNCTIYASKALSADISGIGKINYKGHPVLVQNISGAGTLNDAN